MARATGQSVDVALERVLHEVKARVAEELLLEGSDGLLYRLLGDEKQIPGGNDRKKSKGKGKGKSKSKGKKKQRRTKAKADSRRE